MKRKVVFVATIHRNAERMFPAILEMRHTHDIIVMCAGQVSKNTDYEANRFIDLLEKNKNKISKVLHSPSISGMGGLPQIRGACINMFKKEIPHKETDVVIVDDSRDKVGLTELYRLCKKHNVPVLANSHGNEDEKRWNAVLTTGHERFFDKLFVFGPKEKQNLANMTGKDFFLLGGVPDNDAVADMVHAREEILVIVNFVDPRHKRDGWYLYDKKTFERMRLLELQRILKKPVTFKLKHRFGHSVANDTAILERNIPDGLKYRIISKVENDVKLIENAVCILSYGSTMCFKPIQAKIPTVIFTQLGDIGNFDDYYAKVNMGDDYFDFILNPKKYEEDRVDFLERTVTGGVRCNASEVYAKAVYDVIRERENEK
ncbi:hypothetical protein CMK19_01340 [Candidatus Poribacteria bacterium]|nr:hypothetical protein [Candidatus Poribacteria bacterium]